MSSNPTKTYEGDCHSDSMGPVTEAVSCVRGIDHIALAVHDLEGALTLFQTILGFRLRRRREIRGNRTGMISAELELNGIRIVLCQGTEPDSQVSQLVANRGAGVAHVAFSVDDVHSTVNDLTSKGLSFDTTVITGTGLTQAFSSRCQNTGMSFEFIKRDGEDEYLEENIQELFDQLERGRKY